MKILISILILLAVVNCGKDKTNNTSSSRAVQSCQQKPFKCPDGLIIHPTLPGCQYPQCPGGIDRSGLFYGYGMDGKFSSCRKIDPNKACGFVASDQDRFSMSCKNLGHISFQCDCQKFLCSKNIAVSSGAGSTTPGGQPGQILNGIGYGYDMNQQLTTCKITNSPYCTFDVQPSDRWAGRCKSAGAIVIQCGCHSYLCSRPIP